MIKSVTELLDLVKTEKEILDIFKKLAHKEDKCVIIVTHSQNVCEMVDVVYDLKKVK